MDSVIRIGGEERVLEMADAQWVNQSIHRRSHGPPKPCVEISVRTSRLNLRLATACCPGGVGGRAPTNEETEVLQLWRAYGLADREPDLNQVWPFVSRLRRQLGLRAA